MDKQNDQVNGNNDTEVELTDQQVIQTEEQLNLTGENVTPEPEVLPVDETAADAVAETDVDLPDIQDDQTELADNIDPDDLEAILALGEEVLDLDLETAAGEESDGGGFSLVDFERDGAETIATTDFETSTFNSSFENEQEFTDTTDDSSNLDSDNTSPTNTVPTLTISSTNAFTEDNGSAVEGAVVSTFETSDEDGDDVTVTLSDTVNYEIVGDTVVLTEAGAALVNSGEELPAFTLIPNDGTTDGEAVSVEPSVTTTNDAPEVTITSTNDFTEDDGSAVEGAVVATFETSDEDGDEVTVTLSDTVNYEIVGDTVVLTEAGAALVNSGEELPAFTLIPNDGTTDGEAVSVEPSVTTTNDAPEVTITSTNDFTEDDGSAVEGAVVATFETSDEDGDDVTVTLSDTVNYEIVGDTVVLTEAGAALVNSGEELPTFTLIPNDGTTDGEAVSVEPSVTTTNDAPEVTVTSTNDFTEDDG
ncbi:hypothetical protein DS885_07100, partial [Psychromonas sp. B3M02]|uniref:hypothetical protein n=1 Tax=Psychromonas sp. B3M02 TaxID=2267226 RepID=UPI000DF89C40